MTNRLINTLAIAALCMAPVACQTSSTASDSDRYGNSSTYDSSKGTASDRDTSGGSSRFDQNNYSNDNGAQGGTDTGAPSMNNNSTGGSSGNMNGSSGVPGPSDSTGGGMSR